MIGLFNYQVPGQQNHTRPTESHSTNQQSMGHLFGGGISDQLSGFLQGLLGDILGNIGDAPGCIFPPAHPPEITTLAIGEEDGGLQPPGGDHNLPDVTTKAIGEEDGGLQPPDGTGK